MSSPQSAADSDVNIRSRAGQSESTEAETAEEHSLSVTGHDEGEFESDTISVSQQSNLSQYDEDPTHYMGSRRAYAKKQTLIISKLKAELAQARNTISMAKINDIVILKSKLRAAESDLNRARIQNIEFKENIQSLELRLFELLSSNAQRTVKKPSAASAAELRSSGPGVATSFTSSSNDEKLGITTDTEKIDQKKSGEFQKVPLPVQNKEELWLLKRKTPKLDDLLLSMPGQLGKDVQEYIQHSRDQAAEADRKTISELIKELHHVEELLEQRNCIVKCDVAVWTGALHEDSLKFSDMSKSQGRFNSSHEYSQRELLYSFFAGAIFMLLSVVLSAFGNDSENKR